MNIGIKLSLLYSLYLEFLSLTVLMTLLVHNKIKKIDIPFIVVHYFICNFYENCVKNKEQWFLHLFIIKLFN